MKKAKKRSKQPNTFATGLALVTLALIIGFLLQSTLSVWQKNPLSALSQPEASTITSKQQE